MIPALKEYVDAKCAHRRFYKRQGDEAEETEVAASVNIRSLFDFHGKLKECLSHVKHRKGRCNIWEDQGGISILKPQVADD